MSVPTRRALVAAMFAVIVGVMSVGVGVSPASATTPSPTPSTSHNCEQKGSESSAVIQTTTTTTPACRTKPPAVESRYVCESHKPGATLTVALTSRNSFYWKHHVQLDNRDKKGVRLGAYKTATVVFGKVQNGWHLLKIDHAKPIKLFVDCKGKAGGFCSHCTYASGWYKNDTSTTKKYQLVLNEELYGSPVPVKPGETSYFKVHMPVGSVRADIQVKVEGEIVREFVWRKKCDKPVPTPTPSVSASPMPTPSVSASPSPSASAVVPVRYVPPAPPATLPVTGSSTAKILAGLGLGALVAGGLILTKVRRRKAAQSA